MAAKVPDDVTELDDLTIEDLESGRTGNVSKAKVTAELNRRKARESIDRIKARAIEEGTMRANPEVRVRFVDPASLRREAPAPQRPQKPVYPVKTSEEKPVTDRPRPPMQPPPTQPRPVADAAREAAGLDLDAAPVPEPTQPAARRPPSQRDRGSRSEEARRRYQPPKAEKECKRCGKPFVPRSGNQRYCDRVECRTNPCERDGCDQRYRIDPSQPGQKFCSVYCSQLAAKARDSNPEEAERARAAPPGAGELPAEPDSGPEPQPQAQSGVNGAANAGLEAQGAREGPLWLPGDSNREEADDALAAEYEAADARYIELLYHLVRSPEVAVELQVNALDKLHEVWSERAVSHP